MKTKLDTAWPYQLSNPMILALNRSSFMAQDLALSQLFSLANILCSELYTSISLYLCETKQDKPQACIFGYLWVLFNSLVYSVNKDDPLSLK